MTKSLRRKIECVVVIVLLIGSTQSVSLTFKSCLMANHETHKKVILLDEAHSWYLNQIASPAQSTMLSKLHSHQKAIFTALANTLMHLDEARGAQWVVITETSTNTFSCLAEEEAGAIGARDTGETRDVLPRLFLRHIFAPASTVDTKIALLGTLQPFNATPAASFVMSNKVRWVVGDRYRTHQDAYLSFDVYKNWKEITAAVDAQEELPESQAAVTVGHVKNYANMLHTNLQDHGITDDSYYQKVSDVINGALATNGVHESDHLAFLHKHLIESGNSNLRYEFNDAVIALISQKFDAELRAYLNEFANDRTLKYAFILAGGYHNQYARELLESQGYSVEQQAGMHPDVDAFLDDKNKLTDLLEVTRNNSPFVNMQELLGVNVQDISEPNSISYAKQRLKNACNSLYIKIKKLCRLQ